MSIFTINLASSKWKTNTSVLAHQTASYHNKHINIHNIQYLEHMNLITDAQRAIYKLVEPTIGNNSFFLKNYLNNITLITKKNNLYYKLLNIDIISSPKTEPKIKAEYLLDNNRYILDYINKKFS